MKKTLILFFTGFSLFIIQGFTTGIENITVADNNFLVNEDTEYLNEDNVAALFLVAKKKYRKLGNCTCSIELGGWPPVIRIINGNRFKCKNNGFEECTSSSDETPCECPTGDGTD